ncbi:hypothetical protein [Lentiprolixibacter aurantiacus]|uniref:Peptidase M1 membrane alanine aminopeptidase domain-containing protein n=1 Tax=Lentiprolixibacter aurantiacus TaxID=2993939 RepID=A0AAE3MIB4_9FLAO|nr:hypothetical protein [Lentiprolixibacter aurantiacus]MCX2718098.1 hypothetical protein [Lentiprolixibacter aurantiacus]
MKNILFTLFLGIVAIQAQEADHLSMTLKFQDSTLLIDARYESSSIGDSDSAYFLLNPGYELDTIVSKGLKSYTVTQKKGSPLPFYHLEFDKEVAGQKTLLVDFRYQINLSEQNHMKSNWIELNADKLWFPNRNNLNNELTYEVSISNFPESYHLITHSDAVITKWDNQITISKTDPWYEVMILAGDSMKEWEFDDNITVIGSTDIDESTFRSIGLKVKHSIDILNAYFGKSDPINDFKVVLRNSSRSELGLGYQFNRRDLIVTGVDFDSYGNLSHEIAHFWWNKADFIKEPWMNESFANWGMYQVLRKYDKEEYEKVIASDIEIGETAMPVADASLFAPDAYGSYYCKGTVLLLRLEEKIGADAMQKLLSDCVEKNINSTEGFLSELELLTGKEVRSYFENLLKS